MRPVIMVFAKAPAPGHVKTRLIPPLTPESAARLYDAFVRDTIESLQALTEVCDLELHTDIECDAWRDLAITRRMQYEGNLGLKMFKALSTALADGRPTAFIVGSDAPDLPVDHLRRLMSLGGDVVLGPAEDGGYWAIGARRLHSEMFGGVRWSTGDALADSVRACAACGLSSSLGPTWFDIDSAADLARLLQSDSAPRHTKRALEKSVIDSALLRK